MDLIADALLLAAALVATFYCLAVQRRLGSVKRQSERLGEQLAAFDAAIGEARGLIAEARAASTAEHETVRQLTESAGALRNEILRARQSLDRALDGRTAPGRAEPREAFEPGEVMRKLAERRRARRVS